MSELSFAKSFLSTLDARPIKLQPDHVADLKTLELKGAYTLPRYPSSPTMIPPSSTPNAPATSTSPSADASSDTQQQQQTINLTLKSPRNPPLSLSLPSQPASTSIFELKQKVAQELQREGTDGIKILYQRKPVSDAKTISEVVGSSSEGDVSITEVEFGVMVMGGGAAKKDEVGDVKMSEGGGGEVQPAAQGASGEEVMGSSAFWDDLKGWLMQRVRDEEVAGEVWGLFKRGWDER
ncbi:MAG: hypothetical protein Q9220_002943 [cf. Caloplaca sp. 1 TL-2023]